MPSPTAFFLERVNKQFLDKLKGRWSSANTSHCCADVVRGTSSSKGTLRQHKYGHVHPIGLKVNDEIQHVILLPLTATHDDSSVYLPRDGFPRVHGISGIRIADASIVQRIPSVPTQAMAMMIGDRAASIILADISAKDRMQVRVGESERMILIWLYLRCKRRESAACFLFF